MKKQKIGKTSVEVTEISFGCASIGNLFQEVSEAAAQEVLEAAWASGIRYFDTAPHYGRGLSEQRLGAFLRQKNRDDYTVSTKVGRLLSPGAQHAELDSFINPLPNDVRYDYSGDGIEAAFEQSCERLGTDRIDIIYVHDIGRYTHGDENTRHMSDLMGSGMERLRALKEKGRIGAIGIGVNENEICLDILSQTDLDVILLAGRLTLLDRSSEARLVPLCQERGTSLVLGGIFNSGILATGPREGATFDYAPASPAILQQAADLESRAEAAGVTLAQAALRFALDHPAVASTLIGTGKVSSLQRNLDAAAADWPVEAVQAFA